LAYCLKIKKSPQKVREFFKVEQGLPENPITALATDTKGKTYIGTGSGLCFFDGKKISPLIVAGGVTMLFAMPDGGVWAGVDKALYLLKEGKVVFEQPLESEAVGIDTDIAGSTWLVARFDVYRLNGGSFAYYAKRKHGPVIAMAATGDGSVFAATPAFLQKLSGKRPRWGEITPLNSRIPTWRVNALAADDYHHVWVGTSKGLCVYDGRSEWRTFEKVEALPATEVTKICLGKNGTVYVGTKIGLYVFCGASSSFLGFERWIPAEEVTAISVSADGGELWVGTPGGLSRITVRLMSLSEKAACYEEGIEKYNVREGYVTHRQLSEKGNPESGAVNVSDNDGLWTATFLASQAFRYAVTKDKAALARARRSKDAIIKLMSITGVEGFAARSYRRPWEKDFGDGDPEWYPAEDDQGPLEWKCETSSDETSGHFYGLSLYYDLCADKKEREEVRNALCTMLDYIIQHGYVFYDVDGKPTTWAHWAPEELNGDDKWFWEKGTNSLEMLSYLKTCYYMSGDEKYQNEYLRLIREHHYALNCLQYKIEDAHVNHIDDHLTMISMPALLRYETDPALRQMFLMGFKHHWQTQRVERSPYWNVLFGGLTGEPCDIENAVKSLEEIPLDMIAWQVVNSRRPDLRWDEGQEKFGGKRQLRAPLPFDEKSLMGYNNNTFYPDGDNGKRYHDPSQIFLAPYWAARYFGLIEEE
jgi:hypothetical protein